MKSFLKGLEKAETALVTVALIGMTIAVFLQVFFRFAGGLDYYLESHGVEAGAIRAVTGWLYMTSLDILTWTEELARYFMIWAVFVGAALGARLGVHVGLEAVVNLFPPKVTRAACLVVGFVSLAFCLLLCYYSVGMVGQIAERGQLSPAMEIPMAFVYAAAPVGSFLMAVHFMQAAVEKYLSFGQAK